MMDEIFSRNIGTLNEREQSTLSNATIGVVGLGGIGSPAFEILVRIGVGSFVLFEEGKFEKSNFNRQIYAISDHLGKSKVDPAIGKATGINPNLHIEAYPIRLTEKNVRRLFKCDVVVDGTDNVKTRRVVAAYCKKMRIPYVFCSAGKSMGIVGVFTGADFRKVFGKASESWRKSVIAPAAILAGTLSASQAICVILRRPYVKAPEFIFFDVFSKRLLWKQKV